MVTNFITALKQNEAAIWFRRNVNRNGKDIYPVIFLMLRLTGNLIIIIITLIALKQKRQYILFKSSLSNKSDIRKPLLPN